MTGILGIGAYTVLASFAVQLSVIRLVATHTDFALATISVHTLSDYHGLLL